MNIKNALPILLPALLGGSLIMARAEAQKAQEPHAQVKAEGKLQPGAPLDFRVTGLTKDNLEQVRLGLTGMTTQVYACEGCKHEECAAGKCQPCNLDLKAKKEAVLVEAKPSLETASIRLTPAAMRTLRYSDLASTLMKNSIEIEAAKFPIAGKSRLVLRGGTVETSEAIEKALVDSKFFELVQARFDAASGETHVVVHAKKTAPMYAEVTALLDKVGTGVKLTDVIWGPLPTPAKIG